MNAGGTEMAKSDNLRKAKKNKNDEFYTLLPDIIQEIAQHKDYVRHFQGKTVLCNCDDPEWSSFVEFFRKFFHKLGLKKMISTHYNKDGSPSYKLEWYGEKINGDTVNMIKTPLEGNGDFRSEECIELLKEADIVVTNPPFSIAREYFIPILYKYSKKFVIIGDLNWVAYKDVFPLFKDNRMFYGYTPVKEFRVPDGTEGKGVYVKDGITYQKFGNKVWFTNLDLDKAHEPRTLTKNYYGNEERYPKYENYDAIECGRVEDIPKDYFPCWYECPHARHCRYAETEGREDKALCEMARNGEIEVPVTYMTSHYPEQMQIIGDDTEFASPQKLENGKCGKGRFYLRENLTSEASIGDARSAVSGQRSAVSGQRSGDCGQETVYENHYSQAEANATVSSEFRSHSCQDAASNSLESSDYVHHTEKSRDTFRTNHRGSEEDGYTAEFLFNDCRKCNGMIGVPVTYLNTHCTSQFYILGITDRNNPYGLTTKIFTKDEIQNYSDCNRRGAIRTSDGTIKSTYARLLIRRKETEG